MEKTIEEREAEIERREAALKTDRMRFDLGAALTEARCRPDAVRDAVNVMLGACAVELDDDGRPTKYTMGADTFASAAEAAQAFMSSREYLQDKAPAEKKAPAERPLPSSQSAVADAWARPEPKKAAPKAALPSGDLESLLASGHSGTDLASEGWATPPK